jgi:hypothetical protein
MVPGALEALYRAQESYGARPVSGFANATARFLSASWRAEKDCRTLYVYKSHNKSIQFGKGPDGALSKYKLSCEAAQGKVGSVA